jgi:hypothetical protein
VLFHWGWRQWLEVELGHDCVGHFCAGGVVVKIELGRDSPSSGCAGRANETDERLEIDERPTAPVNADVGKQAMATSLLGHLKPYSCQTSKRHIEAPRGWSWASLNCLRMYSVVLFRAN